MLTENYNSLIKEAKEKKRYKKLILQLKKDFSLCNIETNFSEKDQAITLKNKLQKNIYNLIHHHFDKYLNLLYRIDVSEQQIKNLNYKNTQQMVEQVSLLILLREWQKVVFKNKPL